MAVVVDLALRPWHCGVDGAGGRRALYGDMPGVTSLPPQDFAQAEGYMVRRLAWSPPLFLFSHRHVQGKRGVRL